MTLTTAVLIVCLATWLTVSGHRTTTALRGSLPALRMQALTVERQADEIEQLRLLPAPASADAALLPMVQEMATIAGLSAMLSTLDTLDNQRVVVTFGTIAFPVWIDWLNTLSMQGIRAENVSMETLLTPGLVSTTATLRRTATP